MNKEERAEPREPKISIVEALLIGILMLIIDIAEIIPFVGDFLGLGTGALVIMYLVMKGVNGLVFAVGTALDAIPVIQAFPSKTLAWVITVGIDHFAPKEISEKLEKAGELAEGKAGGGVTAEVGAAEKAASTAEKVAAEAGEEIGQAENKLEKARNLKERADKLKPSERGAEEEEGGDDGSQEEGELEDSMAMGAEVSPEKEAREAAFNPEELQFQEGKRAPHKDNQMDKAA